MRHYIVFAEAHHHSQSGIYHRSPSKFSVGEHFQSIYLKSSDLFEVRFLMVVAKIGSTVAVLPLLYKYLRTKECVSLVFEVKWGQ